MKNSNDYDDVFKTMKLKTKRLFIPVINDIFERDYTFDEVITVLSSECAYLRESSDGTELDPHLIESDYRIRIANATYILECQSYDDDTIQIRITEYAFISAIDEAKYGIGWAHIRMPQIAIIYIKGGVNLPNVTEIRFEFPGDKNITYIAKNIFIRNLSKEYIAEKQLYPYIPFYMARYEKKLSKGILTDEMIRDLEFFRGMITKDLNDHVINQREAMILYGFVNLVIKHITDGNDIEERLVNIMGGTVIDTLYDQAVREGKALGIVEGIEQGIEQGIDKGAEIKLINQIICNKSKGRTIDQIADFLDDNIDKIEAIYEAIGNSLEAVDATEIYDRLHQA